MKTPAISISVTEAARNFSDCINRVRYQGTTFILHKNGVPVARVEPVAGTSQTETTATKKGAGQRPTASAKRDRTSTRRAR
jgi:prevent-host-death family protein